MTSARIPAQRSVHNRHRGPRVSVIIPTFNEAKNLPHVLGRIPSGIFEVLVVDGHSTDDTIAVAQWTRPDVRIIKQTRTGKGNALACGFAEVLGDIAVTVDADGSADPTEIPRFVAALVAGADYAKGTRFATGGGSVDITRTRQWGNRALNGLVNQLYGVDHTDLCYGYNAIWSRHLHVFGLDHTAAAPEDGSRLWGDGFEIETLMTLRALQAGLRVAEVPSFEYPRIHGESNLSATKDGIRVLRTIARSVREDRAAAPESFVPRALTEIDLEAPLPRLFRDGDAARCRVLVRLHGHPIGTVEVDVPEGGLSPALLADVVRSELGTQIRKHLEGDGLAQTEDLLTACVRRWAEREPACRAARREALVSGPHITVVVATRDRTDSLRATLADLAEQDYPRYDVIVVDSAPSDDRTADAIRALPWRGPELGYLRLAEPGLAVAHNAALPHVRGEWVAFTDDDVRIDEGWLTAIAQGAMSRDDVACVTGLLLPAELQTPAQDLLEQFGGYCRGFAGRTWSRKDSATDPLFPYAPGRFGSGANMAYRVNALRAVGGFDPATGAGTPARGGDDLSGFVRILRAGHALAYRPDAVIRHFHHRDEAALHRQLHGYGVGLGAYLASTVCDRPSELPAMIRRALPAARHLLAAGSTKNAARGANFPSSLVNAERRGLLTGPVAYVRSRRVRRGVVAAELERIAAVPVPVGADS